MRIRVVAALGLTAAALTSAAFAFAAPPASSAAPPSRKPVVTERRPFLPDSFVICSVGKRLTTVSDYCRLYFESYIEDRPDGDSLGRQKFLESIIAKDVLGQLAIQINRPFRFEDRVVMRETEQRVLSNALYKHAVTDSLQVTEADIAKEYEAYQWEVRLRQIRFADLATAQRVRRDLQSGRTSWQQAYDRYSLSKKTDKKPDGELGWTVRGGASLEMSRKVFSVGTSGFSEPIEEPEGWTVVQVIERRPGSPPSLSAVSQFIRGQLTEERTAARAQAVRTLVANQIGMVYDTAQIVWASRHFQPTQSMERDERGASNLTINTVLPEFTPEDTSRVLARYRDGVVTLGTFLHRYSDIQPLIRPSIDTPEAFRNQVDAVAFEPYLAVIARERGLDKDPEVVRQLDNKREQIMVEHLYSDSVMSRIAIHPAARRKYYQQNLRQFFTYEQVRFAALWADSKAAADAYVARLKGGERAEDILRADSLLGVERGSIQVRGENEHGIYQKVLFEELREGGVTITGPDNVGHYSVLQKLEHIPGRQLSYEESAGYIDDSMQNLESERLLKELVARHSKKFVIRSHPELVMRIRLVDPTL